MNLPLLVLLLAVCAAVMALAARPAAALASYRAALALSTLPWLLYARWVWSFAADWVPAEGGAAGVSPALVWYAVVVLLAAGGGWAGAALIARRRPVLAAPLPLILDLAHRELALRLLGTASLGPAPPRDDVALGGLFGWAMAATAALAVTGWVWPRRARAARRR